MGYKVLVDSPALYEFSDQKTRLSVFDALILRGKVTDYTFKGSLLIQKQEGSLSESAFVDGRPVEILEVGGAYYISQTVKNIFEKHEVNAEYFDATVLIENELFNEDYYLFNPLDGIDCLDYDKSIYQKEFSDRGIKKTTISAISSLVIDEEKIPEDIPLLSLGSLIIKEGGYLILDYIILINDSLASDLSKANLRGFNMFEIENYRHDWKWRHLNK